MKDMSIAASGAEEAITTVGSINTYGQMRYLCNGKRKLWLKRIALLIRASFQYIRVVGTVVIYLNVLYSSVFLNHQSAISSTYIYR